MTASTASRRALDATFTRFRNEVATGRFVRQNAAQLILACVHHDPSLKLARELCIALGTTLEAFRDRCRAEIERRKAERSATSTNAVQEHDQVRDSSSCVKSNASESSTATNSISEHGDHQVEPGPNQEHDS